jgi:Flp pilus assembly protein protease CpaA
MSSAVVTGMLAVVAATAAGAGVRRTGRTARTRALWWVAALATLAGTVVVALSASPVPVAAGAACAGLAAASVVDAAEGRIPTVVAHATTAVSFALLAGHAWSTGDWSQAGRAVALTAALVAGCALLWLAGVMGFGDVRLSGATVTAMMRGVPGLVALVWAALAVAGAVAAGRRLANVSPSPVAGSVTHRPSLPFAPPLALGWLFSVVAA